MIYSSLRALVQNRDVRWMAGRLLRSPHRAGKFANVLKVQWAKMRRDYGARSTMPLIVSVEPTNSCNMKCPMCPTGLGVLTRRKGMMDLERFAGLVRQLERTTLIMTFWGWGESTLNPQLYDLIRIAHDRGIFTMLTINGTSIDAERILDCGLDYLVVSFDGLREESYRPVRIGGDLQAAKAGVGRLAARKRERGLARPRINMGFIVTRLNEPELPGLDEQARAIGFDATRPKYLHVVTRQVAEQLRPLSEVLRGQVGIVGPGRTIEPSIPGIVRPPAPNGCGLLWEYAMVYWDGTMVPCCYDWDAEQPLGNAFTTPFAEVWRGEVYREFRRRVTNDKQSIPLCRECQGGDIQVFFSDTFLLNR
ncbi:MAG TPA: radical SAM protein [Planctomycetota bacterium]|nr:radical SAM protein [Planctomycetota bacterium]